jgi:hypothetical protein
MEKIERVCPNCHTANPYERARCQRCGASLTNLPAPRQAGLPARIEGAGAAALVLGASALIARTGLRIIVREVMPRVASSLARKPAAREIIDQRRDEQPDYVIRGWRAWSVRRGPEHSSGSEHFEWRINRRDIHGTGKTG